MDAKPVISSVEAQDGSRCLDLLDFGAAFGWVECRRDPEDSHGWRRLSEPRLGFSSLEAARADAANAVGWFDG